MRSRWLAAVVVVALVVGAAWAVAGRDRRRSAGTGDQGAGIQAGGTVTFATTGEPTGFNPNTSKNNSTAVQDVVGNVYPSVFRTHPDFSVRLDRELMEGAELTSEQPQTVTYRIRRDAVWSDGTPISDDDFVYLWRRSNGSSRRIDVASTTGYQDIGSVSGSPDGKTVTVRFAVRRLAVAVLRPPSLPLRGTAAGRLEHRPRPPPRADPVGRPLPDRRP